ncbi:MAG: hypothetical protein AABM66_11820 [Actinomycetota bacterium]
MADERLVGDGSPASEGEAPVYTPERADELVTRITDDARRALRYLLENAPEASFEELQQHLGKDGLQVGGIMASFGFAENAGLPRPYRVDRRPAPLRRRQRDRHAGAPRRDRPLHADLAPRQSGQRRTTRTLILALGRLSRD